MRLLLIAVLVGWFVALVGWFQVVRAKGLLRKFRYLIAATVVTLFSVLFSALLVILHAFQMFAGETLVARVISRPLASGMFELIYTPAAGGTPVTMRLEGDQWSIGGGIVKWHPGLTWLGVASYHKPMRISGQFSDVARQRSHLPTVEALTPDLDRVWEALYWADPYLPFIEAVYGSAAYAYMEPGVVQEVYVTPSGYLIKRGPRL